MRTLIALPYSPWSEKARWALDHHGVAYRNEVYLPMLGEPALRLRTGRLRGRITVPVLIEEDGPPVMDSIAIARHADALGPGEKLFPHGLDAQVDEWNDRADRAM